MTEEEAKTKACCGAPLLAQVMISISPNVRITDAPDLLGRCQGSACMAWRWEEEQPDPGPVHSPNDEDGGGYCGIAGKP